MKTFSTFIFASLIHFCSYSQITDTCEYVSEGYSLGGLDCAWGVYSAAFPIDSYQWVNCDSLYAPFIDDTMEFIMSDYGGNVAVIIEAYGCVDTSYCEDMCTWGINEFSIDSKKEVIKIVDLSGRETEERRGEILIYIYADGTREKVFITE